MSDDHVPAQAGIVERLRNRNNPENRRVMMTEAAAEIERLRGRVVEHERGYEWSKMVQAEMGAEIERLRQRNVKIDVAMMDAERGAQHGEALINQQAAEIERLTALVKTLADRTEKLAFDMAPPNEFTPQFVMLTNAARRALEPKPFPQELDVEDGM